MTRKYQYKIAFLAKKPSRPPSNMKWMLAARGGKWTDEFCKYKGLKVREEITPTFCNNILADNGTMSIRISGAWEGSDNCDYWYGEFPDGKDIMIKTRNERDIDENIETIQRAIEEQYDFQEWAKNKGAIIKY